MLIFVHAPFLSLALFPDFVHRPGTGRAIGTIGSGTVLGDPRKGGSFPGCPREGGRKCWEGSKVRQGSVG